MVRPLSAESVLREPFSVLPGSDFVEWTSVREEMTRASSCSVAGRCWAGHCVVDQAGGMTFWVVRKPRGMVIGTRISRPKTACLG